MNQTMTKKIYQNILAYALVGLFVVSVGPGCNITKNVPKGDALYTGATIKMESSEAETKENKVIKSTLQGLTRPKPNSKLLGIPFKLHIYNLAGKGNKGINKFLKKSGEPPVLLSQLSLDNNVSILTNTLENKGFFHANVIGDTTINNKKAHATYTVKTGPQYHINDVVFPPDSGAINKSINASASKSLLKKGNTFNLDVIKGERLRIDADLKEKGYYFFNPEQLIIFVDSTIGNNLVNLYVKFKPDVPMAAKMKYRINDVYIYGNYSLNSANIDTLYGDTVSFRGYNVIDHKRTFKPQVFDRVMMFSPEDLYSRTDHNVTLSRLINLGTFKFVKNRFEVLSDSFKLDAFYYLTPLPKKSISAEIGGLTKSNNVTGSELTLKWRNRNTFKGAELLTISTYFGTEIQYSGQFSGYNTLRYGAEANLTTPRFLVPIFRLNTEGSYVPRTSVKLGYDVLARQKLFTLNSFRGEFGYVWKENIRNEHELNLISINYVQPLNVTTEYQKSIAQKPLLKRAIEEQFIVGSNYNYNYNQLVDKEKYASGIYFNGLLDLSGNVAGLIAKGNVSKGDTARIFGVPFSQYIKTEADFRYYRKIGLRNQLANRIIIGFGYPYGNSSIIPYSKQFFIGGNNSLRAFRSRSLGPGKFNGGQRTSARQLFADMTGDIKLELNSELRVPLNNMFSTAFFVDAGNIWLYNNDPNQPGGKFSKDFLKELAVGAGVGFRIDVTILLLRLDVAVPLRIPYLPEGQRWVTNKINFPWVRDNLVFNLAIGYPF
ncbi:MAG: BamA/TamA family outer membrane protein [Chitinophagaceae bacterium]|nr:BamA/TamA family outer membrane protein [Chitinophagaceae bacterium]